MMNPGSIREQTFLNADPPYSILTLSDALLSAVSTFDCVFIVIDALDECHPDARGDLFRILRIVQCLGHESNGADCRLFVTSRMRVDIQEQLLSLQFCGINLDWRYTKHDVEKYVVYRVEKEYETYGLGDSAKSEMIHRVCDKSSGM
jgi:hypothetical protein